MHNYGSGRSVVILIESAPVLFLTLNIVLASWHTLKLMVPTNNVYNMIKACLIAIPIHTQ